MKEKLERCGNCGIFNYDPELYSEDEQNNAELTNCGCDNETEPQYVTRDMAIDAGYPEMEGMRL